jgi:hypothetical protein
MVALLIRLNGEILPVHIYSKAKYIVVPLQVAGKDHFMSITIFRHSNGSFIRAKMNRILKLQNTTSIALTRKPSEN